VLLHVFQVVVFFRIYVQLGVLAYWCQKITYARMYVMQLLSVQQYMFSFWYC
jgi:hypothetical protein